MGLAGGPTGPKAVFRDKFTGSFCKFEKLKNLTSTLGIERRQVLVVVDGNVLAMGAPSSITTFSGFVTYFSMQISGAIEAGSHVVVVWDEPNSVTKAKKEEQSARDARRAAVVPVTSSDMQRAPQTDDYTTSDLLDPDLNIRDVIGCRASRARFHDQLCVATMRYVRTHITPGEWSLTFDGVDGRGADRPLGVKREAGVLSSDPQFWEPLLSRVTPIGEGDLKLSDVPARVHQKKLERSGSPVDDVTTNLLWTIDTDSIPIELINQARRAGREDEEDADEHTFLCFREPTRKRRDEEPTPAHFLCCDMAALYGDVMTYMYGSKYYQRLPGERMMATALLAAGLAACGCDFVAIEGLRCDLILPCVRDVVRTKPEALQTIKGVFGNDAHELHKGADALQQVLNSYQESLIGQPRMQRATDKASKATQGQMLRVLWTASYWCGYEYTDTLNWGFSD